MHENKRDNYLSTEEKSELAFDIVEFMLKKNKDLRQYQILLLVS